MSDAVGSNHVLAFSTNPPAPRPCFVCGKGLSSVGGFTPFQPSGGAMCVLEGNYGSTVHDNLTDAPRDFYVCDECLAARMDRTFGGVPARETPHE
jgi:hypothetical protein